MHLFRLRRLLPQARAMAVAGVAWSHRGTVVRLGDLGRRVPGMIADGRLDELPTHARALLALDSAFPTDVRVRIRDLDDGTVTLRGAPDPQVVTTASQVLRKVPAIQHVHTEEGDRSVPAVAVQV